MKKLIYTILASLFLLSCSTNSSSDNSNIITDNSLLLKTITNSSGNTTMMSYNGNKLINCVNSYGSSPVFTYDGNFISKEVDNGGGSSNLVTTLSYNNNLLSSEISTFPYTYTYTYNSDGSITEDKITTINSSGNPYTSIGKVVRYYSMGNCIREENYTQINNVMTHMSTVLYSYDDKNTPEKNILGFYIWKNSQGIIGVNNKVVETHKNASGVITSISQFTYQYNSQNYPITETETYTPYTISSSGTSSTPGTSSPSTITYTYY